MPVYNLILNEDFYAGIVDTIVSFESAAEQPSGINVSPLLHDTEANSHTNHLVTK